MTLKGTSIFAFPGHGERARLLEAGVMPPVGFVARYVVKPEQSIHAAMTIQCGPVGALLAANSAAIIQANQDLR